MSQSTFRDFGGDTESETTSIELPEELNGWVNLHSNVQVRYSRDGTEDTTKVAAIPGAPGDGVTVRVIRADMFVWCACDNNDLACDDSGISLSTGLSVADAKTLVLAVLESPNDYFEVESREKDCCDTEYEVIVPVGDD